MKKDIHAALKGGGLETYAKNASFLMASKIETTLYLNLGLSSSLLLAVIQLGSSSSPPGDLLEKSRLRQ